MLQTVDVGERSLNAYRGVAPNAILDELRARAGALRGARVVHVNATPHGGGISELLRSVVPLLNDLGLVADWKIISGDNASFEVTKKIHNGLQGAPVALTDEEKSAYLKNSKRNANQFKEEYDFVFINDPQPAPLLEFRGKGAGDQAAGSGAATSTHRNPTPLRGNSCAHYWRDMTRPSSHAGVPAPGSSV